MRRLKPLLTLVIAAALLLAVIVALLWRQLLTPEQKLRYGLVLDATTELRRSASQHPDNPKELGRYCSALVREGNLGRALYLMDLYGAKYSGSDAPDLAAMRKALLQSVSDSSGNTVFKLRDDPVFAPFREDPLWQELLYVEGYHNAVLGDWSSAKNLLGAIELKRLPPQLHSYYLYYLARAYRLSGSTEEKAKVEGLYDQLLGDKGATNGLKARARYNQIAYYLSDGYGGRDGEARALKLREQIPDDKEPWAAQKADSELAQHFWADHDVPSAWTYAVRAVKAAPDDRASEAPGQLWLIMLAAVVKHKYSDGKPLSGGLDSAGKLDLELPKGSLTALAQSAALFGYQPSALEGLKLLPSRLPDSSLMGEMRQAQAMLYSTIAAGPELAKMIATPEFAGLPAESRAEIHFEYAELLARQQRWNDALAQYHASSDLHGPREAEALYARYAVLKEVQEPLNLDQAETLLRGVIAHPESPIAQKALEELIPLLIYHDDRQGAQALAEKMAADGPDTPGDPAHVADNERSRIAGKFWLSYLKGAPDDNGEHPVPLRYWTYYELAVQHSPWVFASGNPAVLNQPESTGEFLAGMGLDREAQEYFEDTGEAGNPVQQYCQIYWSAQIRTLAQVQWSATALLESGEVTDPAVLKYVIEQAYPMPFENPVQQASQESGIDPALIYAVMKKESNFKEKGVSGPGAHGLMQIMPGTAQFLVAAKGLPADALKRIDDPDMNIRLGAAYIDSLGDQLAGQTAPPGPAWAGGGMPPGDDALLRAVLHSYNGGPANYAKWRGNYPGADAVLLTDLVPNEENEGYDKLVWKYYQVYKWRLKEKQ